MLNVDEVEDIDKTWQWVADEIGMEKSAVWKLLTLLRIFVDETGLDSLKIDL